MKPLQRKILFAVILLLVILAYIPSLTNEFTSWDDDVHILNNAAVKNFTIATIPAFMIPTDRYMYHPLTMLCYAVEYALWKDNPLPYHIVSLGLHCSIILLLFLILRNW